MLYKYPRLRGHKAYRLNRNLLYFFSKLRNVTPASIFSPELYFDSEFSQFINSPRQQTLTGHFNVFFDQYKILDPNAQKVVVKNFAQAQNINGILSDINFDGNSIKKGALPGSIRTPAKDLFDYLYNNTLRSYGKIFSHYTLIFEGLRPNICPFCGIEMLNHPNIMKQDYDHMLTLSDYTFCGVNMDNLVPTGVECNRINKKAIDVKYNGINKTLFNSAYVNSFDIKISLMGSSPPESIKEINNWVITILPNNALTIEWERVYNIKQRYIDNALNKFYDSWIKEFSDYLFISDRLPIQEDALFKEFANQGNNLKNNPTLSLGNIIKGAAFEFIANHNDPVYRNTIFNYVNSRFKN